MDDHNPWQTLRDFPLTSPMGKMGHKLTPPRPTLSGVPEEPGQLRAAKMACLVGIQKPRDLALSWFSSLASFL